jgi:formylglycine-generating enzyme required for sulfatase activity
VSALRAARKYLLAGLPPEELWSEQPSESYSPIGWHVGHVASIGARWLLPGEQLRFGQFFDPTMTAKDLRTALPSPQELRGYLDDVLARATEGLRRGRLPAILGLPDTFLVLNVAQHELQHAEHVRVVHALCENRLHKMPRPVPLRSSARIEHPGGEVEVGSPDAATAYDNERPRHKIVLEPYWIDRAPATVREFADFVKQGGYDKRSYWTDAGWHFRQNNAVRAPCGFEEQSPDAPVTCLSWFEADAYARWRGARLPTEHELEALSVAPCGVWEWTASWFAPYPGFRAYPYDGYSVPWFRTHRVLRGGSWATSPDLVRPSLRNWYEPGFREIPSGFRCAGRL